MMYYMTSDAFKNMIDKNHTSGSIMHLTQKLLVNFQIPLPPLPIQQRIVEILDKFTSLVSSLDSEIALRQKQYEYYRNKLLSFEEGDEGVEYSCLEKTTNISTGNKPEEIYEKERFEYINAGTTNSGYTNTYNTDGDCITTPSRGAGGIGYVGYQAHNFWCGPLCYKIKSKSTNLLNKYLFYYLSSHSDLILAMKCEGGVPALNRKDLQTLPIPIPPLPLQLSIVRTLDLFESLLTNLKKERELRQKQYEYYREKLLTFA